VRPDGGWLFAAVGCLVGLVALAVSVVGSRTLGAAHVALRRAVSFFRSPGLTAAFQGFTRVGTLPIVVGTTRAGIDLCRALAAHPSRAVGFAPVLSSVEQGR
jgi:hypothetical protein